jgi:phosphate starvation-inducible protein PhoH and related proteins
LRQKNGYPKGQLTEKAINIPDQTAFQIIAGESDKNLKTIQKLLEVEFGRDQHMLIFKGEDSNVLLAEDLINQLADLIQKGHALWPGDIERAVSMLSADRNAKLTDLFQKPVKIPGGKFTVIPKTFHQKQYIESILQYDIVFGVGPAGTGKTYLAMAMAVSALLRKEVKRIVLCRPAVEAGEKLGYLPGDMAEKVNPYLRPLYDALHTMVETDKANELLEKGFIEVAPLAFMRGRTLHNSFVVLDEAQNTTTGQMKMLLTRIGVGSKCLVTGDITQIDLPRGVPSGLLDALRILKGIKGLAFIFFDDTDVIRHPLVAKIVQAYALREDKE